MALQFTTRQIKNAAITTAKIADDAVTTAKIADNAITNAQLGDAAVDTAELAANAVTAAKMDLTGTFDYSGGTLSVAAPTADAHAATKAYVDNAAVGLFWKEPVRAATTANITLSGTQTVDGVSLGAGDRVLVKDQSSASENGVYVVAAGAWSRAGDMNAAGEFSGTAMFVQEGTTYADTAFVCTNDGDVNVGTTAIAFVQFAGNGSIVGGDGIAVTGNSVAVDLATNAGLEINGGKLRAKVKANSGIGLNADGLSVLAKNGVQIDTDGSLHLRLDGSTLAQAGSGVKIADGGVGTAQLAGLAVTAAKLGNNAVETSKINGLAVTTAKIADGAVTNQKLGADAVDGAKIADDAVGSEHIADNAVGTAALGITYEVDQFSGDGSATTFDLGNEVPTAFHKAIMVFVNGQAAKLVNSSPADASEYSLSNTGGTTRITFGAAPESGDAVEGRSFR